MVYRQYAGAVPQGNGGVQYFEQKFIISHAAIGFLRC